MRIELVITAETPHEFMAILAELAPVLSTVEPAQSAVDNDTGQQQSATLDDTKAEPPKRGRPKKAATNGTAPTSAQTAAPAETASDAEDRDAPIEGIEIEDDDVTRNAIIEAVTKHFMSGDVARRELIAKFKTDNSIDMIREISPAQFDAGRTLIVQLDALAGV